MKEVHKLLSKKLSPLFKASGYQSNGTLKWYKPKDGFSIGLEFQKSQWSDQIYFNYYIYIHDPALSKPKKSHPSVHGRISGPHVGVSNDDFNASLDLSTGDVFERTNKIVDIAERVIGLFEGIIDISSVVDLIKSGKINSKPKERLYPAVNENVFQLLNIE